MAELLYDKFKINQTNQLNNEDIASLSLLYMPLIGIDSYALYCTLCCLERHQEYTFKHLIDLTTIKTLKSLNNAFDKLEGIGLLKKYYNTDKGYLYDIISPLKENDFVKEDILMALLETKIGSLEVEKLKNKYKPISRIYKEKTKSFTDVFQVVTTTTNDFVKKLLHPTVEINNEEFNYSLFKMLFDSSFIDDSVLEETEFKRWINRLSYVYKLNEEEMKDVVFKTVLEDKRSDYETLSKNARITFQNKYKVTSPKLVTVKEDDFIDSEQDDLVVKLCNDLEIKSPAEVLEEISGMKPTPSELKIAEDLKNNTNLSYGAINFMIIMVSTEKDGELPSYNYFEKIASTWSRAKVRSAYDAIKYTEKKNQEKKVASKPRSNKKQAPVPEWYSEYEKNLQTKNEETNLETLEQAEAIAKKLFED